MALTVGKQLMLTANTLRGTHEKPGPNSNSLILSWIRSYFGQAQDDSLTAWCGIGMAIFFKIIGRADLIPKEPYRAKNWAEAGRVVTYSQARIGDVVVMWRGSQKSGLGHVTLLEDKKPDGKSGVFKGLGANQSNTIRSTIYSKDRIEVIIRFD